MSEKFHVGLPIMVCVIGVFFGLIGNMQLGVSMISFSIGYFAARLIG